MARPTSTTRSHPAHAAPLPEESLAPSDDESSRVAVRPDGYYWVADDGHQEFGPFATATEALAALRAGIETGLEPDETLEEAESEIGFVEPKLNDEGMPEQ
jgi:hypothetical protein